MAQSMERTYWLISVPKANGGLKDVKNKLEKSKYASVSPFSLPELRIGTLDTLMALMDELVKHDNFLNGVTTKLAKQLVDLEAENDGEAIDVSKLNLDEVLMVGQADMDHWLRKFKWNAGRWDYEKSSLHAITDDIVKTAGVVDQSLRQKVQEWVGINRAISSAQSVATGSVLMRDLTGLLKKENVVDTESLSTLLVVVQKSMLKEWYDSYEGIEVEDLKQIMKESGPFGARVVMPKSSVEICDDMDSVLVSMVVLKRFADQIKSKLRERKFMPRDYSFAQEEGGDNKERSIQQLNERRAAARLELLKYCKTQFTEMFTCWTHLKAIRVWVESVVRFSLPAEFDVALLRPEKRSQEKIRKVLSDLYRDLVAEGVLDMGKGDEAPAGMPAFVTEELYPYVSTEMTIVARVS